MLIRSLFTVVLPLGGLLASLLMCCTPRGESTAPPPPSPLVLRSYEVPNNGAQRLRGVLRDLFAVGPTSKDGSPSAIGRADVAPDGRLLVLAPDDVQEGVKALVTSASAKQAKAPGTLRLVYWSVLGSAVKGDARPPLDEALKDLAPGLAEIEKSDGHQTFTLLEKLTISSLSGERAWLNGRELNVSHLASNEGGQVTADVRIERHDQGLGQRYEARVQLKPGQLVVLASAGLITRDATDASRTVYFFVRAFSNDGE